jgi:DNA-directed RNA polymerase subunit RPC12/RpoP
MRRTRYFCVAGSGAPVVESAHPIGSELHCPYCGKRVMVANSPNKAELPFHNQPTKRERAQMQRGREGSTS